MIQQWNAKLRVKTDITTATFPQIVSKFLFDDIVVESTQVVSLPLLLWNVICLRCEYYWITRH